MYKIYFYTHRYVRKLLAGDSDKHYNHATFLYFKSNIVKTHQTHWNGEFSVWLSKVRTTVCNKLLDLKAFAMAYGNLLHRLQRRYLLFSMWKYQLPHKENVVGSGFVSLLSFKSYCSLHIDSLNHSIKEKFRTLIECILK